jgi:hypothetical protein
VCKGRVTVGAANGLRFASQFGSMSDTTVRCAADFIDLMHANGKIHRDNRATRRMAMRSLEKARPGESLALRPSEVKSYGIPARGCGACETGWRGQGVRKVKFYHRESEGQSSSWSGRCMPRNQFESPDRRTNKNAINVASGPNCHKSRYYRESDRDRPAATRSIL